jgi:5-methylcytosine-specific restriction endonuclease McrA
MTEYKACSKCKQVKPTSEFGKHKPSPQGLYSQCLVCSRVARAEYRKRNKQSIKKQQHDNYTRNAEKRKAYASDWHKANPEKFRKYQSLSKKRNKEAIAANTRRRNARRKANGVFAISRKELVRLSQGPCFYCGSLHRITVDHVVAIARGGADSIGNLVPACKTCNSSKRDLTIIEWRLFQAKGNPPEPKP